MTPSFTHSSATARRRLPLGAAVATLALVGTAMAVAPAQAAPAAAAKPKVVGTYVFSGATKVKSTSKRKLEVTVTANRSNSDNKTHLNVRVATRNGGESHAWDFVLPKKALKVAKSGKGKLVSGSKMGPFGKLTLTVVPTGKMKTASCAGTPVGKSRKAVVAGKFFFNTKSKGSKKWGAIGSKKRAFTFAKSGSVGWSYDIPDDVALQCGDLGDSSALCPTGLSWSVFAPGADIVSGSSRGGKFWVTGSRIVDLPKPKGAHRFDIVTAKRPLPTLTIAPDNNATMVISGTSGTATLTSAFPASSLDSTCGGRQQSRESWLASVKNGSTPFRMAAQVFGSFTIADTPAGEQFGSANFDRTTNK